MDIAALDSEHCTATTASGPMAYIDVGQGRPAVFVHGILANSLLWRHVITAVAGPRRRCIAVDLPGHGHTPPAPTSSDVSLTGLARRVIELCDHLELDEFDLVANDTGGAVAQIVAAQIADRITTLTLTNCDTEGNTPPAAFKPVAIAARLGFLTLTGPLVARSRRLKVMGLEVGCPHPDRLPPEVVDAYYTPVFGSLKAARAFSRLTAAISSADLEAVRPALSEFDVPTLIVWGTGDKMFPLKWGHRLRDLIPGATAFVELDGARMHFPDYRAEEFTPLLQQHWDRYGNPR